ncbi:MAG: two-component system, OmpR family, response regulator MprA [Candidatus Eremiobacteraeota bacterium]|jgi:DNA-binding response OmpR family regulator|nr:two-component system, OmpR family, response regulator MprA [Candidatus Eremiobacteraeota bacterium]
MTATMNGMESSAERVAVIDDEASIREMLEVGLGQEGFAVRSAVDGADGLALVRDWKPQCIVLDVMMPKIDGLALIPLLRRLTEVPIVMLTARGDVQDRIDGLRAGADDYLPKPFELAELAARIHTALRRPMLRRVEHLTFADLQIDLESRIVRRGGRRLNLSVREFDLLVVLARRPNRVFRREELLDMVWGVDRDLSPNTVETYISYLRSKVDAEAAPRLIHTIRGVGYSLREA